nr:siderophore-interacting protein [Janibacter sp. HTCC2649]
MSTHLTVTSSEQLTPRLRRLWFHSDDLSAFEGNESTDRYVKLVFPKPGVDYPQPLDMKALRGTIPPEDMPVVRTYTALFPDVAAGTLAIDFVIHGDEGIAGPWAAAAQPGDTLLANGPGGGYRPDPTADWFLFAGDESAAPAITAALADLPADAIARVVVLVDNAEHELPLPLPSGAEVTFVHRETGGDLVEAVRALEWPEGRVDVFIHGEGNAVMHGIRPYLLRERALTREQVSISGYWRLGRTEEGFRDWKAELAAAESAT